MEKKTVELDPQPLPQERWPWHWHWPWPGDPAPIDWWRILDLEKLVDKQQELAIKVIQVENVIANLNTQIQVLQNSAEAAKGVRNALNAQLEMRKEQV